jgi:tRNA (cytidine/uridine-2'-O-)-methyltransferase
MFHVVLCQPEIPQNTGNIIRLCANTGAYLHLIHPLGFALEDKYLRRAGLDYHEWVRVMQYRSLDDFKAQVQPPRLFALSTKGQRRYTEIVYQAEDALLFGPETRGLSAALLNRLGTGQVLRIPMRPYNRSLNLSNAVAIVVYEAWRQLGFIDAR